MRRITLAWMIGALACVPASVARAEEVRIAAGATELHAHWLPAPNTSAPRPALVLLHGCGGLYRRDGRTLDTRYTNYARRLHAAGYHVLLPDSFGSRGSGPICTTPNRERRVTVEMRSDDAIAAVQWLAQQGAVDARRIALLGWSHGGSTTLTAINAARVPHATPLAGAIAFYPGCGPQLRRDYALDVPLLMLLGASDDWTPPQRCLELEMKIRARQPQAALTVTVYADSHHGFDGRAPVRLRSDVPNGVDPRGVHVGANPEARAAALAQLDDFLTRIFQ
jgi:dienelactone hydrolase